MAIVPSRKTNKYQFLRFDSIKAGDKLRVKSIDWFIQNKELTGLCSDCIRPGNLGHDIFTSDMSLMCGKEVVVAETIKKEKHTSLEEVIRIKSLDDGYIAGNWHDWMFEGGPDIP
jgi:hypothetical protein